MKQIRKITVLLLSVIMIFTLAACSTPAADAPAADAPATEAPEATAPAADGTVYEFTFGHQWSATSQQETELIQRWIKDVADATDGHVIITSYPGNVLTAATDNYQGVVDGIQDIGAVPYGYSAGRFPVVEAFTLPGLSSFNNAAAASYAMNDAIEILDPEELHDTSHLFTFSTGASALLSSVPVRTMEDNKGLSLGVTQGERARMLELLGATPVSLPVPEWYDALQKNLIVGGIMSPEALFGGTRLGEVTGEYITNSGLYACTMFYVTMNKEKFATLPAEYQEVLTTLPDYFATAWDGFALGGIVFTKEQHEVEIIALSKEEEDRWREAMAPIIDDNLKMLNDRGLDGEAIHKLVREMEEKWNAEYPHKLRDMIEAEVGA